MREIPLTKGAVAKIDSEDYDRLSRYSWRYHNGYAARTTSRKTGKRTTILMHREIMGDIPSDMDIDHINGDKSDNRKGNLRIATRTQNMHNSPVKEVNKTGYKGVSYDKRRHKYRARITANGEKIWLGYFDNSHDAARMYNFWAIDLYGEYAFLNKIKEDV